MEVMQEWQQLKQKQCLKMCYLSFHTFNTNLRDSGFLSSNEHFQAAQICSDVKIHHICKLWLFWSCQMKKTADKRRVSAKEGISKYSTYFLTLNKQN